MGGVVAVSSHARSVASLEMMVGLMYLAAVVSRLFGFTTHTAKPVEAKTGAKPHDGPKPP